MLACYTAASFLGALLLFSVQPYAAKLALPLFGGTSAVWTTSMLFFQGVLLAGYAYAHVTALWLSARRQAALHILLAALAAALLPIGLPAEAESWASRPPVLGLLWLLAATVGVPLFMTTSTAPLLQRWFATLPHPSAHDPYFLYVASNAGSMAALVAYPFVIEPTLRLGVQAWAWSAGYVVLAVLLAGCAVFVWRVGNAAAAKEAAPRADEPRRGNRGRRGSGRMPREQAASTLAPATWLSRARWVALAFVPSSWLLGVTAYLTTDIAPIPLLWMIPLALYLASFIAAFSTRGAQVHVGVVWLFPLAMVVLVASVLAPGRLSVLVVHLGAFFLGSLLCHGELVRRRPPAAQLTEFYLWLAVGGMLGGLFNALVAPALFPVLLELPLAAGLACLVYPGRGARQKSLAYLIILGLPVVMIAVLNREVGVAQNPTVGILVLVGAPLMIVADVLGWTWMFGFIVAVALAADQWTIRSILGNVVSTRRSFFGVHRVVEYADLWRALQHGATQHGMQFLEPDRACEPLGYHHDRGPLGDVFALRPAPAEGADEFAVVGLGIGACVCYTGEHRRATFYELDPVVLELARDSRYFTYLSKCGRDRYRVVLGDGRLQLDAAPDGAYSLLVIDAFSSDAIPTHLLTREALALYIRKLAAHGLVAMNISNRYLDLVLVVKAAADDLGLACLVREFGPSAEEQVEGLAPCVFCVLARNAEDLAPLAQKRGWSEPRRALGAPWTDDFSDLAGVIRWRPALRP